MTDELQQSVRDRKLTYKNWLVFGVFILCIFAFYFSYSMINNVTKETRQAERRAKEEERIVAQATKETEKVKQNYRNEVTDITLTNVAALNSISDTFRVSSIFWTQKEVTRVAAATVIIEGNYLGFKELNPPDDYKEHYSLFLAGLAKQAEAMATMRVGVDNRSSDKMKRAINLLDESGEIFYRADKLLK